MKFVDEVKITVAAGDGGNGAIAFRREKFVPFGGPSGGDGGRGGNVVLVGDEGLTTLLDLRYTRKIEAPKGQNGANKDRHGRGGKDREVRVPVGTQVYDLDNDSCIGEVLGHRERLIVAKGGNGGWGNIHFATPTDRAPRKANPGQAGERRELRLELKVLADVGLLGFPNVGKSTLIARVSAAKPKIADYPFTTLTPNLGVVAVGGGPKNGGSSFVMADIPGLIEGASQGAGLGHRFLRHVERTRALLHLVSIDPSEGREPLRDYLALRKELEAFDPELAQRPELVALSKSDLPDVQEAYAPLAERFLKERGVELLLFSAATGEGVDTLIQRLSRIGEDDGMPPSA